MDSHTTPDPSLLTNASSEVDTSKGSRRRRMTRAQRDALSTSDRTAPRLSLGRTSFGRVIQVKDGNTLEVNVPFRQGVFKVVVRLRDISVAQFRPSRHRSQEERDAEIERAKVAKQKTISKVGGRFVFMHIRGQDRHHRYLVTLYLTCTRRGDVDGLEPGEPIMDQSINDWLIDQGVATPFVSPFGISRIADVKDDILSTTVAPPVTSSPTVPSGV